MIISDNDNDEGEILEKAITYYLLSTLDFDQLVTFFVNHQFALQTFVSLPQKRRFCCLSLVH